MLELKENKQVLIITGDMIPHASTWGGAQRMYYLSEFLLNNDCNVTVFSIKKNTNNYYGNEINFNTSSLNVKNTFFKKIIYSKASNNISKNSENKSFINNLRNYIKSNRFLFKLIIFFDKKVFNEPGFLAGFISRSWISGASISILSFIEVNKIENIIISAPPFGLLKIAVLIRKKFNKLNIVLDYRDPWNLWKENSFIATALEKKYLHSASTIVCTNINLAKDMALKFKLPIDKFKVIENGYSSSGWSKHENSDYKKIKSNFMTISYVGVMDLSLSNKFGYRDITNFLKALDKCLIRGMSIKINFIGVTNQYSEYAKFLKNKYKHNIGIIPLVDSDIANQMMLQSDVLLLLHTATDNSSKYIVSGKLYDYIKANRVIYSIGSNKGIHADMIFKESLGVHSENFTKEIYNKLRYLYRLWGDDKLHNKPKNVDKFSRESQYQKYLDLIND